MPESHKFLKNSNNPKPSPNPDPDPDPNPNPNPKSEPEIPTLLTFSVIWRRAASCVRALIHVCTRRRTPLIWVMMYPRTFHLVLANMQARAYTHIHPRYLHTHTHTRLSELVR